MTIDIEKRAQELTKKEQDLRAALKDHDERGKNLVAQYNECIGALNIVSEMLTTKVEDKVITEEVEKK